MNVLDQTFLELYHYTTHYSTLIKSSKLLSCHTCVYERLKNDFTELHTEIEGIIKEKNDSLLASIMPNSPTGNLSSTPIIDTLPTSIIAISSHLDISRSQTSSSTSIVLTTNPQIELPP